MLKKKHIFVPIAVSVITAFVLYSYSLPRVYEAKCTVFLVQNVIDNYIKGIALTPSMEERVGMLAYELKSRSVLLKVIKDLDLDVGVKDQADIEALVKRFQGNTTVSLQANRVNNRVVDLFVVSYRDENPALAREYVNTVVRRYIEESQSKKKEAAYEANEFLSEQIRFFKEKINTLEAEIVKVSRGEDISLVVDETKLRERLIGLENKLHEWSVQYTENYPEMVALKAEIKALQEKLKNRPEVADGVHASHNGQRKNPGGGRRKLADLQREQETYKKIYEDLVATLGKSEVSKQVDVQDKSTTFKIVEPAELPTKPVGPDRIKIMLFGMAAGVAGGGGIILFLDAKDSSVKSVSMLKSLGLPILAIIPKIQTDEDRLRKRKKDIILYVLTGLYLACYLGVFAVEFMGLSSLDDFLRHSFASLKDTIKNIF